MRSMFHWNFIDRMINETKSNQIIKKEKDKAVKILKEEIELDKEIDGVFIPTLELMIKFIQSPEWKRRQMKADLDPRVCGLIRCKLAILIQFPSVFHDIASWMGCL